MSLMIMTVMTHYVHHLDILIGIESWIAHKNIPKHVVLS